MLPLYKHILVTTDFSTNSDHAFKHAVMLARQNNAQVHLLHVVQQIDSTMKTYLTTYMGEKMYQEFEKNKLTESKQELKEELDAFAAKELADFPEDMKHFVGTEIAIGDPVTKIIEVAAKNDIDVIVMGTHGKGFLEHAFLGSVAEKVLRKSPVPVLAIPLKS